MLDIVIRNAKVCDGTGNPWFFGTVGVKGDRIVVVERCRQEGVVPIGAIEIDANGRTLTPGFIDIHRHSDWTLLVDASAESALEQGLTTEVIGNCGYGPAPAPDNRVVTQHIPAYSEDHEVPIDWIEFGAYLARLDCDLGINVVPFVGHGPIRSAAMGVADRHPSPEELARMRFWLAEALDSGAFGMSTGLEYPPYRTATPPEEIYALCTDLAARERIYVTHTRNRWFDAAAGVEEALGAARLTGVKLQISHITARGLARHETEPIIRLCREARDEGIDISCDTYPYEWAPGPVYELLPDWAVAGDDPATVAERFSDERFRKRVAAEHKANVVRWVQLDRWDKVMLVHAPQSPEFEGKLISNIAREIKTSPWEAIFTILMRAGEHYGSVLEISQTLDWDDIVETVKESWCSLGSDAITLSRRGPLANEVLHPGCYGFAPRAFDELWRIRAILPFHEVVRRMTSLPAAQLGLWDRGLIRPGMSADLVIVNETELSDNSTWTDFNKRPSGIDEVIVNGVHAVSGGRVTSARGGRVLRPTSQRSQKE